MSDIAGQDSAAHFGDPANLITKDRDWLGTIARPNELPGGHAIATHFEAFRTEVTAICGKLRLLPDAAKHPLSRAAIGCGGATRRNRGVGHGDLFGNGIAERQQPDASSPEPTELAAKDLGKKPGRVVCAHGTDGADT